MNNHGESNRLLIIFIVILVIIFLPGIALGGALVGGITLLVWIPIFVLAAILGRLRENAEEKSKIEAKQKAQQEFASLMMEKMNRIKSSAEGMILSGKNADFLKLLFDYRAYESNDSSGNTYKTRKNAYEDFEKYYEEYEPLKYNRLREIGIGNTCILGSRREKVILRAQAKDTEEIMCYVKVPIQWVVLEKIGTKVLLFCNSCFQYDDEKKLRILHKLKFDDVNVWTHISDLYLPNMIPKWLKEDFAEYYFNEKEKILSVDTPFFLTVEEFEKYKPYINEKINIFLKPEIGGKYPYYSFTDNQVEYIDTKDNLIGGFDYKQFRNGESPESKCNNYLHPAIWIDISKI